MESIVASFLCPMIGPMPFFKPFQSVSLVQPLFFATAERGKRGLGILVVLRQ